jgi:hypothetical protein
LVWSTCALAGQGLRANERWRLSRTSSSIKRRSTPTSIEAVPAALARIEPVSLETMGLVAFNFETIHRIEDIDGWMTL